LRKQKPVFYRFSCDKTNDENITFLLVTLIPQIEIIICNNGGCQDILKLKPTISPLFLDLAKI
jgi:hypothetical protein